MRNEHGRQDLGDRITSQLLHKMAFSMLGLGLLGYVAFLAYEPLIWAWITGALFVFASGLFTAKIFFNIQSTGLMWFLTPVFGLIWLLFFFLLWLIHQAMT